MRSASAGDGSRAVGYLRRSTEQQPLSLAAQREAIERWAAARGVAIVAWFEDDALSGATALDRAGFQRMIAAVEAAHVEAARQAGRGIDLVLCYDVSRFGRTDTDEAGFYRYRLRQAGAEVVYVAETAVTGGDADDLILPVLQYQKREFLRSLSRDSLRGSLQRARAGAWCGGPVPFGYEVRPGPDGARLVLGAAIAVDAVRWAWDAAWLDGRGLDAIRDELARRTGATARGRPWSSSTVRALVRNPVYTGRASYGRRTWGKFHRVGEDGALEPRSKRESGAFEFDRAAPAPVEVEGAHPAIASVEATERFRAWERAERERIRARAPQPRGNRFTTAGGAAARASPYLLSGLCRCARCGYAYNGWSTRRKGRLYMQYACAGRAGCGPATCSPRWAVGHEILEAFAVQSIELAWPNAPTPKIAREILATFGEGNRAPVNTDGAVARLRAIDARMVAIAQAIEPEHAAVANSAIAALKLERARLEAAIAESAAMSRDRSELADLATAAANLVAQFRENWDEATLEERRVILRRLIAGARLDPVERTVELDLFRLPQNATERAGQVGHARSVVTRAGSGGGILAAVTTWRGVWRPDPSRIVLVRAG